MAHTSRKRTSRTQPARLVAYCRVSTAEQADEGHSLGAQEAAIRATLRLDATAELVEVITDPGHSGSTLKRPGIERALRMLVDGEADGLVVRDLSRLTRSVRDLLDVIDWFDRHNLSLRVLDLGVDTSTPMGRAHATIIGAVGEMVLGMIRENTRQAFRVEGSVPLARLHASQPTIDPKLVRRMRTMHDRGMSYSAIARKLNAEGVPTARDGRRWYHATVLQALGQRAVARRKPATLPERPRRRPTTS